MIRAKKCIAFILCACVFIGMATVPASAVEAEKYPNLDYSCYTYIGDSISWGYGLTDHDMMLPEYVCSREAGSYGDLVGKVLEAKNPDAVVYSAACSGGRLCDYRMALERGMGYEKPYTFVDWYSKNWAPDRNDKIRGMGKELVEWISESDLISMQLGFNDVAASLIITATNSGLLDFDKIGDRSDYKNDAEFLSAVLRSIAANAGRIGSLAEIVANGIISLRQNSKKVLEYVLDLAPEDADILLVGYYNPAVGLRQSADTDFSPLSDIVGMVMASLDDFFADLADQYDRVYFVDTPDTTVFFEEGTLISDALSDQSKMLWGIHPDAEGHEYIAKRILEEANELHTCEHKRAFELFKKPSNILNRIGYTGIQICADCGKTVSLGKIITPVGRFDVPEFTISQFVKTALSWTYSLYEKIVSKLPDAGRLLKTW